MAYLTSAQAVFFVSAYAMHIVLGRWLGPAEYGVFGVVLYAATMIRTFVASGIPMAVSRYVAADTDKAEAIFRRGFQLQLILALSISTLFFLFASFLANSLGDPDLAPLFRLVAPITVFFGIFFLVNQYYNGLRLYKVQSFWLTVSYILRASCTIGLAVIGWRVFGAVAGLVLAMALACLLVIFTRRRRPKTEESYPAIRLINFALPLVLASIAQAFLTDLDLMFVKRLIPRSEAAGWYTSAKALAYAVPFTFYALSSALYPAVSNAYASGDSRMLRGYIRKSNQLLLILILPAVVIAMSNPSDIIVFFYGSGYTEAAQALQWLVPAFSLLAVFIIHKSIITASGFPKVSSTLTLTLLPLCIGMQLMMIPWWGLSGAAFAAAGTFFLGATGSSIFISLKFRALIEWKMLIRILLAGGVLLAFQAALIRLPLSLIPRLLILGGV
jgi:O-antigen/teichoic acid export membrane protein